MATYKRQQAAIYGGGSTALHCGELEMEKKESTTKERERRRQSRVHCAMPCACTD